MRWRLIEATVAAVRVPVTLKMRLGWDHATLNAPELARRAEAAGVRMITVHGRTRCQFYDGSADWAACAPSSKALRSRSSSMATSARFDDADHALERSGADAVMIGRAAQGRPWFPGQVARYLATGEREARAAARRATHADRCALRRNARPPRLARSAAATPASISAGRSMPRRQPPARRSSCSRITAPACSPPKSRREARRLLADAYDAFAWRAAA